MFMDGFCTYNFDDHDKAHYNDDGDREPSMEQWIK